MAWSWWAWSPVKCTTLSASHGAKPARARTIDAGDDLGDLLGDPGAGLADPVDQHEVAEYEDQHQDQLGDDQGDGHLDPAPGPRDGDIRQAAGEGQGGEHRGDHDQHLADDRAT